MSPPPEKKKFAKNVSDSRTYFSSAQSSGSAEVRVNVAVMWQICAICAVLGGDLRIIRLCSDCSLTPSSPFHLILLPTRPVRLWHLAGLATVKLPRPLRFSDLWNQNDPLGEKNPQTLQKNSLTAQRSQINRGHRGRFKRKGAQIKWHYICYVI